MSRSQGGGDRVAWLDGIRGAAAIFVVLHHIWLTAWPGFPRNTGPWWLGWLLYGHMAVAVFIVVSGFSLALAPMRNGGRLSGPARGASSAGERGASFPRTGRRWCCPSSSPRSSCSRAPARERSERRSPSTACLLQDVVGSVSPNGALWSIAVEWQIYFVFPLLLLLGRRIGLPVAVLLTAAVVLMAHAVASIGAPFNKIDHLTPQFLVLFALGVLAVRLGRSDRAPARRRPWAPWRWRRWRPSSRLR